MGRLQLLFAIIFLLGPVSSSATLVNVDVKRVIDVSSTLAISRTTIKLRNDGKSSATSFYLAVHKDDVPGLGDFWVTLHDDKARKALIMKPSSDVPGLKKDCSGYEVFLTEPLETGVTVTVDVRMDVANVIKPVPAEIERFQSQYVVYTGNAHFYSPYVSELSETNIALGSNEVTSQVAPDPAQRTGKRLRLGPYDQVDALSHETLRVRFRNDRGLLVAERASKKLHVSHWGGIAVTEMFDVRNAAARHVGEWSRIDHSALGGSRYATAIDDVWANLPSDATRVEYRDLIGNVTTSKLRRPTKSKRAIQLMFRFPLMGGWRNQFWVRYDLALSVHGTSNGMNHRLSVPLMPSLDRDVLCEKYEVSISLPEWASDIEVEGHPSLKQALSVEHERVRSSMTVFGRPVVRLSARMLRSQSKHANSVVVRYAYNPMLLWVTPLIAVVWILVLFVLGIACARLGVGAEDAAVITERQDKKTKKKDS